MFTSIVTAKGQSKYAIIARYEQHSLRGAWLSSPLLQMGGGVAGAVAAAVIYSLTTPKKNTLLKVHTRVLVPRVHVLFFLMS